MLKKIDTCMSLKNGNIYNDQYNFDALQYNIPMSRNDVTKNTNRRYNI